jgi:hypothetical protein
MSVAVNSNTGITGSNLGFGMYVFMYVRACATVF